MIDLARDRVREVLGVALIDEMEDIFEFIQFQCCKKGQLFGPDRLEVHVFASDGNDSA